MASVTSISARLHHRHVCVISLRCDGTIERSVAMASVRRVSTAWNNLCFANIFTFDVWKTLQYFSRDNKSKNASWWMRNALGSTRDCAHFIYLITATIISFAGLVKLQMNSDLMRQWQRHQSIMCPRQLWQLKNIPLTDNPYFYTRSESKYLDCTCSHRV